MSRPLDPGHDSNNYDRPSAVSQAGAAEDLSSSVGRSADETRMAANPTGPDPVDRSSVDVASRARSEQPIATSRFDPAGVGGPVDATVRARPPRGLGGIKVGSAFFGWLSATGLTVLLVAILAAVGVGSGWVNQDDVLRTAQNPSSEEARSLGIVGGIIVLVVLFISYVAGGYVAGRMARFKGIQQGFAVWVWGLVMAGLIAILTAITGYGAVPGLDLPAFLSGALGVAAGWGILVAALAALIGALLGGLWGMRFHRRVDRAVSETVDWA